MTVTALAAPSETPYGAAVPVELPLEGRRLSCTLYLRESAEEICPAPITEAEWRQIGEMALTLHRGLGLSVYSRSDFILDEDGNAWCLEVNTLPGMTPTSLVPQEAAQVGLSYADLCERIVTDSLALRKAAHL